MGYEIKVTYSSQDDTPPPTKTIKVGKADEDVPVEHLAARIMGILANRAKTVESIELAEFRRKPISFKDDDDGIYIGNKKFRFDSPPSVSFPSDSAEVSDDLVAAVAKALGNQLPSNQPVIQPHQLVRQQPHQLLQQPVTQSQPEPLEPLDPSKVKEAVKSGKQPHQLMQPGVTATRLKQVYQPNGDYYIIVQRQNIFLTIGRVYEITATKTGPMGEMMYCLVDDKKRTVWVDSIHFDQPNSSNVGDFSRNDNEDLLNHANGVYEDLRLR